MSATDVEERAPDPFFLLTDDSEWNACIGRQGNAENYVDGYMEAAIELVEAVVFKGQHGKRDTMAMPILYNARHAVELSLKFAIGRLVEAGVIAEEHPRNHDISGHWHHLKPAARADERLRLLLCDLEPFVLSLHAVDEDGQQLRYAQTQDGAQSLEEIALCNLVVIGTALQTLNRHLLDLKHRCLDLLAEARWGIRTPQLSRRDLKTIAGLLPPRAEWHQAAFDVAKSAVRARFEISSNQFTTALNLIQQHREMGGMIGLDFPLRHLTDEDLARSLAAWSEAYPPRERPPPGVVQPYVWDREGMRAQAERRRVAKESILAQLEPAAIADLNAVFQIGRGGEFAEAYDEVLDQVLRTAAVDADPAGDVDYLLSKMNLLTAVVRGLQILGRPQMAARLQATRPDLFAGAEGDPAAGS